MCYPKILSILLQKIYEHHEKIWKTKYTKINKWKIKKIKERKKKKKKKKKKKRHSKFKLFMIFCMFCIINQKQPYSWKINCEIAVYYGMFLREHFFLLYGLAIFPVAFPYVKLKGHRQLQLHSHFFQESWDFYIIRNVYLCSDSMLNLTYF